MNRLLYCLLLYLALPFILLRLLYRAIRSPAYLKRWNERFGFVHPPNGFDHQAPCLWIHAVSVGESLAAAPLVRHLQKTRPGTQLLVTTMTPTGSARVLDLFGEKVFHVYLPYDYPGAVNRFLRCFNPQLLIIMETELWPNMVYYGHRKGVKLLLANARLSEKSARGYRLFGNLTRKMLGQLDMIAAQTEADGQRLIALGAIPSRLKVTGSLKFDMEVPRILEQDLPAVFRSIKAGNRPVWIAASTREGEEEKVLFAFRHCLRQQPDLLLVLVPRHPERFTAVARLCEQQGLQTVRRSTGQPVTSETRVFLGDSMGEMWFYFSLGDIAFVGGSLVNTGCHNVLEPAALGLPVIVGPSQFNFAGICRQMEEAGALRTVSDESSLGDMVAQLLQNSDWRKAMGSAGKYVVEQNRGSLLKLVALIDALQPQTS